MGPAGGGKGRKYAEPLEKLRKIRPQGFRRPKLRADARPAFGAAPDLPLVRLSEKILARFNPHREIMQLGNTRNGSPDM